MKISEGDSFVIKNKAHDYTMPNMLVVDSFTENVRPVFVHYHTPTVENASMTVTDLVENYEMVKPSV